MITVTRFIARRSGEGQQPNHLERQIQLLSRVLYSSNAKRLGVIEGAVTIGDGNRGLHVVMSGTRGFAGPCLVACSIQWYSEIGMQDIKMSRLAGDVTEIYYHRPSLVQHAGVRNDWGGKYHRAIDFNPTWKSNR
jgi:hypothetical protein